MSTNAKKIFLAFTIIVPFLAYCIFYYAPMIRNAPFKSDEFISMEFKWGYGNDLVNSYDSGTGEYNYLDNRDSLIRTNVKLRKNDIIYLHNKASELGFWNFPELIANRDTDLESLKSPRYIMILNYKRKSKRVTYLSDYNEIPKLKKVAGQMKILLEQTINDAEQRYRK